MKSLRICGTALIPMLANVSFHLKVRVIWHCEDRARPWRVPKRKDVL